MSLDTFLEWSWRRSDEREARREAERAAKRQLLEQISAEKEAKRQRVAEATAARRAEAEARAAEKAERGAERKRAMAQTMRSKVPRALWRLQRRGMIFANLSRFDRSLLIRYRGGVAKVAPTKVDDEALDEQWAEVAPSAALLDVMCARAAEQMEVA